MIKNYKFKTKPYEHQLKALEKSWASDTYALFMEMGTGKSKVLVDNIAMLYDRGAIKGALIVAPKGVYKNWDQIEFPVHLPDHVEHTKVLWEPTITKKKQAELDTLFDDKGDLKILIMNVEAFSTTKGLDFARSFLNIFVGRALIGIDESTTIKNPTAKRTKNILKLADLAKYRRILTGSPVTKSPLDLFSQCEFLDPYHLGHASYYSFRARYANMVKRNFGGRQVQLVVSYRRLDELADILDKFSYRVLKEDCLDLPEKVFTKRLVELTPEQDKAYKQMKQMALAMLDNGEVMTTVNVMTQLMRLHQITCGHFKADDGTTTALKNNRIDALMQLLEETEGKVIIWANYREDIKNIVESLKKAYGEASTVEYHGGVDATLRQDNIAQFQEKNSPTRYFVGNAQTGGYGITLTSANTVVYYSNSYDLEKRLQSEDRAHRIGQTGSVTYVDLIAENTVDDKIVKSLRSKINIANEIMGEDIKDWI
jgi:SNF2 family DNA or RNA helicase|tara:strand:- start:3251 stop:4699 length:1449 start_codon:yes stop_codon:yes gene_type:complete